MIEESNFLGKFTKKIFGGWGVGGGGGWVVGEGVGGVGGEGVGGVGSGWM